jgi:electron transport complex protein RnfC
MMGKAIISANIPVTKGTSGILILTKNESVRRAAHNCIRCAKCVAACPMGLEPHLLMNLTEYKLWEEAKNNNISACIECGTCCYTCPANRPLLDYIRLGKKMVMDINRTR